jgi:DNA-binding CsgD family transcriptional regulator
VWLALLAGHWCAVDHRDRDGKRLVLVVANAADAPLALAAQEREVLVKTAAGYPLKEVAYELGVGASTVSALLRSALRKFRLASPSEAVRLFSSPGV